MKRDDRSPQHYIDSINDADQQAILVQVRELILSVAPESEEIIEYGMLGYAGLANLAAQKNYVSLYVLPEALAAFKEEHPSANCGKSCLRFSSAAQFDPKAIKKLLRKVQKLRK